MHSGSRSVGTAPTPRRHFLALLFIDLSGSSALANQLEFETLAALLERIRLTVGKAVSRNGGRVVRTQGDGCLAVFGHPKLGEHDTRRACQAALEAHAEVASWPALQLPGGVQRLALHSGIHSGLVYVSAGDQARGELDVVGDAANTAARLAAYAGRDIILADADSLGPELAFFETSAVADLVLPGRALPVRAVRVQGVSVLKRRIDAKLLEGISPLLGRDLVLAQLLSACTRADPARRLIEIRGPAGIGKTRLLDELTLELARQGLAGMRGGCESYGITPVLEPFRQLLAHAAGGEAEHVRQDEADEILDIRKRTLQMLHECDDGEHILLLDDWQWADGASRQLLDDLLQATSRLRVVVASREADEDGASTGEAICPQPLSPEETRRIVHTWVPGANPFLVEELHEYAGGVPLLVEEMCHVLRHRGEAGWRNLRRNGPRAGSGSWVKSMMAARLDSLGAHAWSVAQAAAVCGIRSPRQLLGDLVPGGIDDNVLKQLSDADLLYGEGSETVRFRHGLSRDAVYELIPLERRIALHRSILTRLESESTPARDSVERLEALAHHAQAAGDWERATLRCEAAAAEAMRLGAFDSARRQYLGAIEAAEFAGIDTAAARTRWCLLVHNLAMTCMFDPLALPESLPLVERCAQAARELDDAETLARSLYWKAYLLYVFGQPRRAVQTGLEAQALAARLGRSRLLAQIDATMGQALAAVCRYPEALAAMEVAVRTKQQHTQRSGAPAVGSAFTLACLASVLGDQGDFASAHSALAQARELISHQPNHPVSNSLRNWEMVVLAWEERWDDVLAVVQVATESALRSRALLPLAISRAVGGYARWRVQRNPGAMEEVAEAVHWMETHRVLFFTTLYYGWLVEMAVEHGLPEDARRWAIRLLQRARAGERLGEAVAWRALALQASNTGDWRCAWRRFGRAEASARRRQSGREAALNSELKARLLQAHASAKNLST